MACQIIYEGQLMKKGKVNKAWKNRWCILCDVNGEIFLEYYSSKIDANLCGTIEISQVYGIEVIGFPSYELSMLQQIPDTVSINDKIKCQQKYSFILITKDRKFIFAAFDPVNFFKWLSIFDKFVYGGIIKQGWLQKRGEKNKGWKKRYFVLNQYKQIKYYQDQEKKSFQGAIDLNGVLKVENGDIISSNSKEKKYTFQLLTDKRIWILSSNSLNERRSWSELIDKWRRVQIENKKQRLLSDGDIKENDVGDDDELQLDVKHKVYQVCSSGDDETEEEDIEQYVCSCCHKIYASYWPKCPGCLRRGTHIIKPKHIAHVVWGGSTQNTPP